MVRLQPHLPVKCVSPIKLRQSFRAKIVSIIVEKKERFSFPELCLLFFGRSRHYNEVN